MKTLTEYTELLNDTFTKKNVIAPIESSSTASQAYTSGEKFFYNNILYEATSDIAEGAVIIPAAEGVSNSNCTPADDIIDQIKNKVDWDDYAQTGAVNLLPNTATTRTVNGITFTVHSDGSVTATGTATANAILILCPASDWKEVAKSGSYTLSGCPSGGSGTTYYLQAEFTDDGSVKNFVDYGSGSERTVTDGLIMGSSQNIYIVIVNGYAITNSITFYPMITPTSYNGDYVPYAKTNAELTDNVKELTTDISDLFKIVTYSNLSSVTLTEVVAPLYVGYYMFTPPSGYTTAAVSQLYNNGAFVLGSLDSDIRVRILSQNPIMDANSYLKILFKKN